LRGIDGNLKKLSGEAALAMLPILDVAIQVSSMFEFETLLILNQ
jgi:hypothetical protein